MGLSARGSRHLGETAEKIEDQAELAQVRKQAGKVQIKASAAGLLVTLLTILIP